jgi:hypothetical protein
MELLKLHAYQQAIQSALFIHDEKIISELFQLLINYIGVPKSFHYKNLVCPTKFFRLSEDDEIFIQGLDYKIIWHFKFSSSEYQSQINKHCYQVIDDLNFDRVELACLKSNCPIERALKINDIVITSLKNHLIFVMPIENYVIRVIKVKK